MAHTIQTSRKRPFEDFASDNGQPTLEKESESDSPVTPSGDGNMCSRCLEIDFDEIFTRKYKDDSSFVMNLGSTVDLAASQCQICKMFLSATSPSLQASDKQCHLRVFSAIRSLTRFVATSRCSRKYDDNNLLGVLPEMSSPKSSAYNNVWEYENLRCDWIPQFGFTSRTPKRLSSSYTPITELRPKPCKWVDGLLR
jgi:hypothetical protein